MSESPAADILAAAREIWGHGVEPTTNNLHAAAVGLASRWYRNTDAVEFHAHSRGPWTDVDMLRNNAHATHLCRNALTEIANDTALDPGQAIDVLEDLLNAFIAMLPTNAARRSLRIETGGAAAAAGEWLAANGLGNWLASFIHQPFFPKEWWGAPDFAHVVDQYCRLLPGPPDAGTFRERMLHEPWTLSDEQAAFVCDRRYDVSPSQG